MASQVLQEVRTAVVVLEVGPHEIQEWDKKGGQQEGDNSSRRLRAQRRLWVKWLKCSSTVKAEILVGRDRFSAPVAKRRNHPFQNITAGPRIKIALSLLLPPFGCNAGKEFKILQAKSAAHEESSPRRGIIALTLSSEPQLSAHRTTRAMKEMECRQCVF